MTATPSQTPDAALTRALALGGTGYSVAIKECLAIAGLPVRCGSAAMADSTPATEHSNVVAQLLASNCQVIGTANMHELAFGVTGFNGTLGTPINPNWPQRIPGGSSSGSAVLVARGACDFALGTDTGGSMRMPAACCGIFGMKPTFGRISRKGALPAQSSLDCIGPMTRSAAMMTQAMAAIDPSFEAVAQTKAPRIRHLKVAADDAVQATFNACLANLPHDTVTIDTFDAAYDAGLTIINAEQYAAFGDLAASDNGMDAEVRARILAARAVTPEQVTEAETVRTRFTADVDAALMGADVLILPTLPVVPPTLEDAQDMRTVVPLTRLVRPFNLSGHPAMTLPILTAGGLPAGFQIVAAKGHDAQLCAVAEWLAAHLHQVQEDRP